MFDKLIESEPEGADFRNRKGYFITSSLVVGVLFLAAVVISIFAADYSMRAGELEFVELLAPIADAATEPAPPKQPQKQTTQTATDKMPTRQVIMARVDETPHAVPDKASVTPNTQLSRPPGAFKLGPADSTPVAGESTRGTSETAGSPIGIGKEGAVAESQPVAPPLPPPIKAAEPEKPKTHAPVSKGVLNGSAKYLPKPVYSAAAQAVNAQGTVQVQILIDERGQVVSAKAVSGNILLRPAAEAAARNAKFSPTLLSDVPVKVTGIITYNFTRS